MNIDQAEMAREKITKTILDDYKLIVKSRETSLLGRKEVLTGKAKFGIFGDGKELAQLAMAKVFKNGDFRSGYYRDQTFMMAIGQLTVQEFFAQLYAHTDVEKEPASGGRMMNGHYGTRSLNEDGSFKSLMSQKNSSSDISPTAGQMPRLLGLAQASKYYRATPDADQEGMFTNGGNEIAFGTIGNASTSEGLFFETINAAGVLQVPMIMSVWDDEYGISVHAKHQTTKESISKILAGFQRDENDKGYEIITARGWNYLELVEAFEKAEQIAREEHVPVLIHVNEVTQPQGHSTSGSHERYKSKERLEWETEFDCVAKMRSFILEHNFGDAETLDALEKEAQQEVKEAKREAWTNFLNELKEERNEAVALIKKVAEASPNKVFIEPTANTLEKDTEPIRKAIFSAVKSTLRTVRGEDNEAVRALKQWLALESENNFYRYSSHLVSEGENSFDTVPEIAPEYSEESKKVDARVILRDNFDTLLAKDPRVMIFGEDSGYIGDVNQGLEGLQEKHGENRVSDTGIREATILGQGIGLAMRGLRPIAEIQYLDYLLYALQIMSDDLATVRYRTMNGQKAPLIVRTRGHRLEGVWHSGSPMGMIIHALRGMHILVPRNMTKAAGFYNTLLQMDDPALIVECLNGYRLKEQMPENLGSFTTQIGKVETIHHGEDITIVSYGSTLRVIMEAVKELEKSGISCEVIDVQSLLPFDIDHDIVESIKKTNRVIFIDEDVPGGATAYMMQKVLEEQNAYFHLDSEPKTLASKEHRPAYGTDGDYFSKPNVDDVFDAIYDMMSEVKPNQFPSIY
ncbi:MAG: thiamine pyrophosphate-dependent enzyme [Flavobacteriales bacterium]|jgi:pyruvate/2-oxoglutarate/acetoin dehydrogenase E1 component/TPP-dependent pyruvate/acetoin dehydrogenase alpha subunit|nr:thiamine pyrophosphate-dependent enzyme [Flavobacteriales bacterium]